MEYLSTASMDEEEQMRIALAVSASEEKQSHIMDNNGVQQILKVLPQVSPQEADRALSLTHNVEAAIEMLLLQ